METCNFNEHWQFTSRSTGKTHAVTLPHDAMLEEGRSKDNPSGAGEAYFAGGFYTYEKHFHVPSDWEGKQVIVRFEGIYPKADIFINEKKAGEVFYGYSVTDVEVQSFLHCGAENVIRIEVDNEGQPNSRWYSGAGMIRPVTVYVLGQDRIDLDGICVKTTGIPGAGAKQSNATIHVTTYGSADGEIRLSVWKDAECVAEGCGRDTEIVIPDAVLWNADHPELYLLRADLIRDNVVCDSREVRFGIRKITWSREGFFVNGESVLLRGGCIHHDNGVLGACGYPEAERRRIRILKENGFNAIRSAHNPCTASMLEACDEFGMYVMDEGWDMWTRHKTKEDYASRFADHWQEDAASMIRKDQNHPSVILYSIGNEISEPASPEGFQLEKDLVAEFHRLDPSRPVTCGMNLMILANAAKGQQMYDGDGNLNAGNGANAGPAAPMDSTKFNQIAQMVGQGMNHAADSDEADQAISPVLDLLDIAGYNYGSGRYPLDALKHPDRVILGSETLPPDLYDNWEMVKKYPSLVGDFMWTAWDYLGEAGIGVWSDRSDAGNFTGKLGSAIASGLVGVVMGMAGYDGTLAVQSATANNAIIFLYNLLPIGLYVIMLILSAMYKVDSIRPQMNADLEKKHAAQVQ